MKQIYLTQGKVAFVDDEDLEALSKSKWCYATVGYAVSRSSGELVYMHHCIIGKPPAGQLLDHIDLNKLNNQKRNLRFVNHSDSLRNRARFNRLKVGSQYKGVSKVGEKWRAVISIDGKPKHIGCYPTELEAAHAFDRKAIEVYGDSMRRNFYA